MYYAYKYRLKPSDAHREALNRHRDICRQLYNHTRYRLNEYQDEHGELPSMATLRSELPTSSSGGTTSRTCTRRFSKPSWNVCSIT